MELIYTDAKRNDIGYLKNFAGDFAMGADENNFSVNMPLDENDIIQASAFLYQPDAGIGGIVDSISIDSAKRIIYYEGRTFEGILNSKVIIPPPGQSHYVVSGDLQQILRDIIAKINLETLFTVKTGNCGISTKGYKFSRYVTAYTGISDMLADNCAKLLMQYFDGKIKMQVVPISVYNDDTISQILIDFFSRKDYNKVNHIIALGSGEMENRLAVNLYADADGNISETQTITGERENVYVYDLSLEVNPENLKTEAQKKLKELQKSDTIQITPTENELQYDIGDEVQATDEITGISVTAHVYKKIITENGGNTKYEYEVM